MAQAARRVEFPQRRPPESNRSFDAGVRDDDSPSRDSTTPPAAGATLCLGGYRGTLGELPAVEALDRLLVARAREVTR